MLEEAVARFLQVELFYTVPAARPTGGTSEELELDSPVEEMSSAPIPFIMFFARLISSEVSQCTERRIPPFAMRPS